MTLQAIPLTLAEANALVTSLHRHHKKTVGHRFSIGVIDAAGIVHGAAIAGRPVARKTDSRAVLEVARLVTDGTPNACSLLYAACARAAQAMGFEKIQTFILASETGTSLKAAGWTCEGVAGGLSWSVPTRPREDKAPAEMKTRWSRALNGARPAVIELVIGHALMTDAA